MNSYKFFAKEPLPFAILAEEENEYTKLFDKTIIIEKPTRSYVDKVEVLVNMPWDETIFIESDILAYGDLNRMFEDFIFVDGFSMQGRMFEVDSGHGWFRPEEIGDYRQYIQWIPSFSSGVMYLNNRVKCEEIYKVFKDVLSNFDEHYNIGGSREMIDDKCLAVSIAVERCRLLDYDNKWPSNYPFLKRNKRRIRPQMHKKKYLYEDAAGEMKQALSCHWGTFFTRQWKYRREVAVLNALLKGKSTWGIRLRYNFCGGLSNIKNYVKWKFSVMIEKIKKVKWIRKLFGKK